MELQSRKELKIYLMDTTNYIPYQCFGEGKHSLFCIRLRSYYIFYVVCNCFALSILGVDKSRKGSSKKNSKKQGERKHVGSSKSHGKNYSPLLVWLSFGATILNYPQGIENK